MKRRALLSTLVAGTGVLAGCQGLGSDDRSRGTFVVPDRDEETTTGTSAVPAGVTPVEDLSPPNLTRAVVLATGPKRRLVVTGHRFAALPGDVAVTAGFLGTATASSPTRLWIAFSRTADAESDERRVYEFGPTPPFSGYRGRAPGSDPRDGESPPPPYLVPRNDALFYADQAVKDSPERGCWRVADDPEELAVHEGTLRVALAPGESIVGEYSLVSGVGSRCRPDRRIWLFQGDPVGTTLGVATWAPSTAVPARSAFDRAVPPLPDAPGVVWFHETTSENRIYLEPGRESLSLPTGTVEFHLENFSSRAARFANGGWRLYKLHDGTWRRIGPWRRAGAVGFVAPGGRATVEVAVDNHRGRGEEPIGDATFTGLGSGLYAVRFGRGPVEPTPDGPVRFGSAADVDLSTSGVGTGAPARAALVSLSGDPVDLTLPPSTAYQRRDDDAITVALGGDAGSESTPFVVRRATLPAIDRELITEQVYQSPLLRAALASLESYPSVPVARVVASGRSTTRPIRRFGGTTGRGLAFEFEGETFVATAGPRTDDG